MIIENRAELLSHGYTAAREVLISIAEKTLAHQDYLMKVKEHLSLDGNILRISDDQVDLSNFKGVFLLAGGKHSSKMAKAVKEILGDNLNSGIVIDKDSDEFDELALQCIRATHPIPDEHSFTAGNEALKMIRNLGAQDLLIVCVSGGWTSLVVAPLPQLKPEDVTRTYDILLKSGMPLKDMNAIRNRLSLLAGGKLLSETRVSTVIGLIAVDEIGGNPWGPTVLDKVSGDDVERIVYLYGLESVLPDSVLSLLKQTEVLGEKAKDSRNQTVINQVISNNQQMCEDAQSICSSMDLEAHIVSTVLEGEAKDLGGFLCEIAMEISGWGRPFRHPCVLIAGGETTVTITGEPGKGGRNQELALSGAIRLSGRDRIAILSMGTDGTDGPTEYAGAIADGFSAFRMSEKGYNPEMELKRHNSSEVLSTVGDTIIARRTGTNLMDLMLIYVA